MQSVVPLVTLRRCFALLVLFSTARFVLNGWVQTQVLDPVWTFPFDGFEWLPRPNFWGAASLFLGMFVGGVLMFRDQPARVGSLVFSCALPMWSCLTKAIISIIITSCRLWPSC